MGSLILFVQRVAAATTAELLELEPVRRVLFVLCRYVIALFTIRTLQNDVISSAFRHFLTSIVRRSSFVVRGCSLCNDPRTTNYGLILIPLPQKLCPLRLFFRLHG
jgi:hypothetical protein